MSPPVEVARSGRGGSKAEGAWWVAVPTLCHASIWDTDHPQNAADLVALADALEAGPRLYIGHSAGGLASLMAGADDPDATAVITLDGVDADGLGEEAAPDAPTLYGILGEASSCNSSGNGEAWFSAAPDATALRLTEADHCDFEADTDWMCTVMCTGSNGSFSDEEIQATLRSLLTAAALEESGLDEVGEAWWAAGGEGYDALLAAGAVESL